MDSQGQISREQEYQKIIDEWGSREDELNETINEGESADAYQAFIRLHELQGARKELNQIREDNLNRAVEKVSKEHDDPIYMNAEYDVTRQLRREALKQNGSADAVGAANGEPLREQVPAKQTYKQKKEESRRDKRAQRFNKNADHVSYNMAEQLQNRRNAANDYIDGKKFKRNSPEYIENENRMAMIQESGLDKEMLKVYYQEGEPKFVDKYINAAVLDKRAEKAVDADKAQLANQAKEARTEALDILVNDLLKARITPDMFQPAYLETHMGEMKALSDRMRNFKQIRDDAKNGFYFDSKDKIVSTQVKLLDEKLAMLTGDVCAQLDYAAGQKAVDVANGGYMKENQKPAETETHSGELAEKLEQWEQKEKETAKKLFEEEAKAQLKEIMRSRMDTKEPAAGAQRCREIMEDMERIRREHPDGDMGMLEFTRLYLPTAEDYAVMAEAYAAVYSEHSQTALAKYALAEQKNYEKQIATIEKAMLVRENEWKERLGIGAAADVDNAAVDQNILDGANGSGAGA